MQQTESNINNYKGVMLCSRPNENKQADFDRPFCARVVPSDALGLTPFSKLQDGATTIRKKTNPVLAKHKRWLEEFANKQRVRKELEQTEKWAKQEHLQKIREQGQQNRETSKKMKDELSSIQKGVMDVLDEKPDDQAKEQKKVVSLNPNNLKKMNDLAETGEKEGSKKQAFKKKKGKEKPAWAYTQEEYKKKEENEQQELLDFFEHTDIDTFVHDIEVHAVLKVLKDKIQNLKKEDNWRQKQVNRIRNSHHDDDEDAKSAKGSMASEGAKSVASERSSKRIEQLQKQKEGPQQWETQSKGSKFSANYEEKIAKNVADEVLRNYGTFKGVHSNVSIRKLLEREAMKQLDQKVPVPTISTVNNASVPLNVSNLPYLHRNPAI